MAEITTNNFQETQQLAQKFIHDIFLSKKKRKGALVLALEGDLGSGKTTFAQGIAKGLSIKKLITSPTFVLVKKYGIGVAERSSASARSIASLFHIDCYRLEKSWQLQELGFEEIINNPENIVAIEWAEKISEILPEDAIKIMFEYAGENERKIIFK